MTSRVESASTQTQNAFEITQTCKSPRSVSFSGKLALFPFRSGGFQPLPLRLKAKGVKSINGILEFLYFFHFDKNNNV